MSEDLLRKYVERVSRRVRIHAAILFGSRARGDHGPWSDYDLLLIGDFREPYLQRLKMLFDLMEGIKIPIEPHPYTLSEALGMLGEANPTIVDAIEEGKPILIGKEYEKLLEKYRRMKKKGKLRRTRTSITF